MNNSRILTIKNAEFSGYYFQTNLNIWGDFQICISVPLKGYYSKSRVYKCYNLFTCGEYNSPLKKWIFMVHTISKCLVEQNSYSKTIILTEIFIIIHLLSISNKALKYFLNHTKTFKKVVTSNAYSLWPTDMISISWEWLQVGKAGVRFWMFFAILGFF